MNTVSGTVSGFSSFDLGLRPLATAGAVPAAQAGGSEAGSRWIDGLDGPGGATLSADLTPGAAGLSAAEHAQRVLGHLLDDGSA